MLNNGVISGDHDVGLIAPIKNNSFKLLPAWLMLNLVFCLLQLAWTRVMLYVEQGLYYLERNQLLGCSHNGT